MIPSRAVFAFCLGLGFLNPFAFGQTASEPNEGSRLRLNADGTRSFAWWGRSGRTYFLKTSEDLVHWSYLPMIQSGAGQAISWGLTTTAPKSFFKLQYTDQPTSNPQTADFDGDQIGNADELRIGTDPFVADVADGGGTDPGNGIPDAWERAYGLSTSADGNADSDGDGISDYDEYLLGLNPSSAYTNGGGPGGAGGTSDGDLDSDGDGKKNNEDQYPADERRTEDIAGLNYAILDVSKNVMPTDKDVDQIALGADGRVAYSWWEGETRQVAKWSNGQIESGSPRATATKIKLTGENIHPLPPDNSCNLNSAGNVVVGGPTSQDWDAELSAYIAPVSYGVEQASDVWGSLEGFVFEGTGTLLDDDKFYGWGDTWNVNEMSHVTSGLATMTLSGTISIVLNMEAAPGGYEWRTGHDAGVYFQTVSGNGTIAARKFGEAFSTNPSSTAKKYVAEALVVPPSGAPVSIRRYDGSQPPSAADAVGTIDVINDSKDFILADSSEGKFLYYKATAKVDKLEKLLPEKYRKQFRFESPATTSQNAPTSVSQMISLANSGKLVFKMECLEGRGRGEWVTRTFVSDKDATQPATSNLRTLQQLHFPENYQIALKGGPQGLTDKGLLAVYVKKTKTLNLDGTYTPIPNAQQKWKPSLSFPFDLDVDADNTTVTNYPDTTKGDLGGREDAAKNSDDEERYPGVRIYTNLINPDKDYVPGYADGIDKFGNGEANSCWKFEPLIIDVPTLEIFPAAKFKFKYSASDPDQLTQTGSGMGARYSLPSGKVLRLWKKDGDQIRKPQSASSSGDFIKDDQEYTAQQLGWQAGDKTIRLYIEVVEPKVTESFPVEIEFYPSGMSQPEIVNKAKIKVRPYYISRENAGDEEEEL